MAKYNQDVETNAKKQRVAGLLRLSPMHIALSRPRQALLCSLIYLATDKTCGRNSTPTIIPCGHTEGARVRSKLLALNTSFHSLRCIQLLPRGRFPTHQRGTVEIWLPWPQGNDCYNTARNGAYLLWAICSSPTSKIIQPNPDCKTKIYPKKGPRANTSQTCIHPSNEVYPGPYRYCANLRASAYEKGNPRSFSGTGRVRIHGQQGIITFPGR